MAQAVREPRSKSADFKFVTVKVVSPQDADEGLGQLARSRIEQRLRAWSPVRKMPGLFDVRFAPGPSRDGDGVPTAHDMGEITLTLSVSALGDGSQTESEPLCEACFDIRVKELRAVEPSATRRLEPKPLKRKAELCEECAQETLDLVQKLEQVMEAHEHRMTRKFRKWGFIIASLTLVATAVPVSGWLRDFSKRGKPTSVAFDEPAEVVITRPALVPTKLRLYQPYGTFEGIPPQPMTSNSFAPEPESRITMAVGGSAPGMSVFLVAIEGGKASVWDKRTINEASDSWKLDRSGVTTLMTVTIPEEVVREQFAGALSQSEDDMNAGDLNESYGELLASKINAALSDGRLLAATPELPQHFHAVWEDQTFDFDLGSAARSSDAFTGRPNFRAWADQLIEVIGGAIESPQWALSGRSFPVKID